MSWKNIWNKRTIKNLNVENEDILTKLFILDGYDRDSNTMNNESFNQHINNIVNTLKLTKNDTVFEVGCGAGAILYALKDKVKLVGGCDQAKNLIKIAKKYLNDDSIKPCIFESEALNFNESIINPINNNNKYDHLISVSVFHYFPNMTYAQVVIDYMLKYANKSIGIYDIPNKDTKYKDVQNRINLSGGLEYYKKYNELPHLYYSQSFWNEIADFYNLKIDIIRQNISEYDNSNYRYNVILTK